MTNLQHIVKDISRLKSFLSSPVIYTKAKKSSSILVQVYSSKSDQIWMQKIRDTIAARLPDAVIVGTTTAGEIAEGRLLIGSTIVTISFFDSAIIKAVTMPCFPGEEWKCGQVLRQEINETGTDIAGVLLFATPLSMDVAEMLKGMSQEEYPYPIFGGGAGVYTLTNDEIVNNSMIFCDKSYYQCGVAAIVFFGEALQISIYSDLGWKALSKEMTITQAEGMKVKKIDGRNAFDIYKRYLNIEMDNDFMFNVLQFPFLLERGGKTIARVPFFTDDDGGIEFIADIQEGERFCIGYGNPEAIIQNSVDIEQKMKEFVPETIFIFNCICHRFFLQNEVDLETKRFQSIAPTVGFYTYGEFYGKNNRIQVQNSTMIIIGMREGDKNKKLKTRRLSYKEQLKKKNEFVDPYANRHNLIVSRMVHFIGAVTAELEQANRELTRISEIDKLTQVYNRMKLDQVLEYEFNRSELLHFEFSIIMVDVDHFKEVNDYYGHNAGDEVLKQIAAVMKKNLRESDYTGRWGGEEFLLILPRLNEKEAGTVAEKLRTLIELYSFPVSSHQTCSFGVTGYSQGDSLEKMLKRADKALYEAKNSGRNKVAIKSAYKRELDDKIN